MKDFFYITINSVKYKASKSDKLIDICTKNSAPIDFMCRAGSCGTCLINVIEGEQNLSSSTEAEDIILPILTDKNTARLACQVKLKGSATIEFLD